MNNAHALARDEMIRALTAYPGIATADGAADGTTIVDSNLIGKNDFVSEKAVLIMSGPAALEDKGAASFDNVTGTITLQGTGFSAQITAGTIYRILNISSVEIDVANINTKIGTNADAPGTTTLFAWLAKLFEQGGQGLVYYGKVTQVDDGTHFRVSGLTGFGNDYFANTYRVYVVRDAGGAGAAPQGEMQPCSDYTSSTGRFTHTAFSAGLAVDDEVLLVHERIAEIKDLIDRLGTAADAAGTTTVFARLKQIVDTYLADGTIGLAALKALIDAVEGKLDDGTSGLAALKALIDAVEGKLDDGTSGLAAIKGVVDAILVDTGTTLPAALAVIAAYVDDLETRLTAQRATNLDWLDITTFDQETAGATDVNGTTWKDLLDKSTITKPTKICGFKVTKGGTWAGNPQIRITDGAGTKIFPFQDQYEMTVDFSDATQVIFNFTVNVPVADGYKFQFRSTNAADGAGETLQLNNLDMIEIG